MKSKNLIMLGLTTFSLGVALTEMPHSAHAASWHSSAISPALRGTWHGKYTGQKLYIYKHTIRYAGESAATHIKWKYLGNHFYRFKYRGGDYTILLHWFNHHKITTNSMEHTFTR